MRIKWMAGMMVASVVLASLLPAQEPVRPPVSPRVITATRQVTEFTALETQLLKAVQKKDRAALQSLVSDDFMIFMPGADPLPGEEWMEQVMGRDFNLRSFETRGFTAAALGDSVLVAFNRSQQSTYKGKADSGDFFVVDLWQKSGDSWKLLNRYVAKANSMAPAPRPAHKPTGKQ